MQLALSQQTENNNLLHSTECYSVFSTKWHSLTLMNYHLLNTTDALTGPYRYSLTQPTCTSIA
eukprot:jgi/Botrbrau1/10348/Bobra.0321s0023.1